MSFQFLYMKLNENVTVKILDLLISIYCMVSFPYLVHSVIVLLTIILYYAYILFLFLYG